MLMLKTVQDTNTPKCNIGKITTQGKCPVVSPSSPQARIGLIVSPKLFLKLCYFRTMNGSFKRVRNFTQVTCTLKI